jgi:hypothetical protein
MGEWIWMVWGSGFAVHSLTQDLTRKQAAGVFVLQFACGALLHNFGHQLDVSGSILLVNLFHILTAWLVQYLKRQELQKLKRGITQQWGNLFQ